MDRGFHAACGDVDFLPLGLQLAKPLEAVPITLCRGFHAGNLARFI
jgi:hypothetical protein